MEQSMTTPLDEARLRELAADLLRVDHEADEWPLVIFQGRLIHIDNVLKIASDALSAERERADDYRETLIQAFLATQSTSRTGEG